ncbi:ABC transporter ATP-binding protein [Arthrobacter sp. SX1312]|uniref:ABC transporter ATP-binding protein n=1 Tax=Arthrobacter sp. SX1312 TaxID=2058896 RepID=UPI000CE36C62|nr:ABC transporter ATP-binding protein [Arthrobacter sp. SX1312]
MIPAIETFELTKRYGAHQALHGLDLDVTPGAVFGLIGPNGAGKTTTLRILLDIIRPTSGTARILGTTPGEGGPALRRRIGYVPGELRLEGRLRGRQLLRHLAEISGPVPPGTIDRLADRLGVNLDRPVRALSKGNKQKLGLIQAFMHHPELLVLDEPTSGLDPLVQRTFLEMVREARDAGQTVLLSSHVLSEIQQTADEVAVLSGGRIVAQGRVDSLRLSSVRHVRAGVDGTSLALLRGDLEKLPGLSDIAVTGDEGGGIARLGAKVEGDIDPFVKLLARHRVVDLTVEEPDLEESVLQLYGSGSVEEATHV